MIPKGGKYAKSVVNFVRKAPENWPKFKEAIKQIDDLLKQGKLKLDGKQKTIFESNKNILKNHEKVTKKVEVPPVKKEDVFKGWTPTLVERSNLRNIYKELDPPASKYTKEMEAIDEELDALAFGGEKYEGLSSAEKATIFKKLQAEMKKLINATKKETKPGEVKKNVEEVFFDHPNDPRLYKSKPKDLTTLSLSQINKKSQNLQKRIREISEDPNIKGTVTEGPKRDMIKALYDSENAALMNARKAITKRNSELKYGKKYPVLDPENDTFIILGLDDWGNPIKISRFMGRFSATKGPQGDLTRKEGTSFYDKWNAETGTLRKEGKEVFHETLDSEGKVIMSNPNYKLPETELMELQTEFYTNLSTSDLAKKGYKLKDIDMIVKGRKVREYLEKTKNPDVNISMHEQTSTNEIGAVMEDLYNQGDDVYKMTMKEWVTKIPEYFAGGGRVPGFATGGVSNLFRQREGYRDAGTVIKLAKGARWLIRMLKEMSDDMIFGRAQFAKMTEALKMKYFKETQSAIKHLESGGPIPENLLQSMRADKRFQNLTVSKGGDKDFVEIQEVVLESKFPQEMRKFMGKPLKTEDFVEIDLIEFKKTLPKDLLDKVNQLPVEKQTNLLTVMKRAFDSAKKGNIDKGVDVLQEQLLTDFIPKGKPHATGGLINGYATGGVSNLFRRR